jgi:hypothetical protein
LKYIDGKDSKDGKDHDESCNLMNTVMNSSCTLEGSVFIMPSPPPADSDNTEGNEQSFHPQMMSIFISFIGV